MSLKLLQLWSCSLLQWLWRWDELVSNRNPLSLSVRKGTLPKSNLLHLLCFFVISTQHLVLSLSDNSPKRILYVKLVQVTVHVDYKIFLALV